MMKSDRRAFCNTIELHVLVASIARNKTVKLHITVVPSLSCQVICQCESIGFHHLVEQHTTLCSAGTGSKLKCCSEFACVDLSGANGIEAIEKGAPQGSAHIEKACTQKNCLAFVVKRIKGTYDPSTTLHCKLQSGENEIASAQQARHCQAVSDIQQPPNVCFSVTRSRSV